METWAIMLIVIGVLLGLGGIGVVLYFFVFASSSDDTSVEPRKLRVAETLPANEFNLVYPYTLVRRDTNTIHIDETDEVPGFDVLLTYAPQYWGVTRHGQMTAVVFSREDLSGWDLHLYYGTTLSDTHTRDTPPPTSVQSLDVTFQSDADPIGYVMVFTATVVQMSRVDLTVDTSTGTILKATPGSWINVPNNISELHATTAGHALVIRRSSFGPSYHIFDGYAFGSSIPFSAGLGFGTSGPIIWLAQGRTPEVTISRLSAQATASLTRTLDLGSVLTIQGVDVFLSDPVNTVFDVCIWTLTTIYYFRGETLVQTYEPEVDFSDVTVYSDGFLIKSGTNVIKVR